MAAFCKHVTGMVSEPQDPISSIHFLPLPFTASPQDSTSNVDSHPSHPSETTQSWSRCRTKSDVGSRKSSQPLSPLSSSGSTKSLKRRLSHAMMTIRGTGATGNSGDDVPPVPRLPISKVTEDVADPRFHRSLSPADGQRKAGDLIVYSDSLVRPAPPNSCTSPYIFIFPLGIPILEQRHDP